MITVWQVVSIPFWVSGVAAILSALRLALKKGDHLGGMMFELIVCGVLWYIAARIAGY
jgi:hypothetical protein